MSILAGEARTFSLNPSRVTLTAPEDCECERVDKSNVIITLNALPRCKIHLDIVWYDPRFGQYYSRDSSRDGNLLTLRRDIIQKFGFDPDDMWPEIILNNKNYWYKIRWWRDSESNVMDVWLRQYDSWMFRVMAAKLTKEESSHIRSLIENIQFQL
ncbi:MAG: hypothetical protein PHH76_03365 [Methanothrix soehngenii]|jgi:hypothetical protein|uniref:hypothetical protein n=1 Tax=Methanothrix soehngenii TaxID=2223 RepID=UPI0023F2A88A|nr:hypothetical protein [Methanothrix soehngenii]MDD5256587.1 hypothetical protein [Methanothrix soehngenii]